MAATIIDNGGVGFSTVGSWSTYNLSGSNQYGFGYHYSSSGSGADVAYWQFSGLATGSYQVSACWVQHASHAGNATYEVYLNGALQFSQIFDQRFNPASDVVHNNSSFQHLNTSGLSINSGDSLVIQLNDNANGTVIADAIAVDTIASTPTPSGNVIVIED